MTKYEILKKYSFPENLRNLMEEKDISQRDLAKILKVSQGSVWQWCNDNSVPNTIYLISIADYFGVTTDELLFGEKTKESKVDTIHNFIEWLVTNNKIGDVSGKILSKLADEFGGVVNE